ncbi:MAG: hypothetical protein HQ581_17085, partial [Planctomycetes bacterium]|nr:hypothetical protein [Planctomycetota bacterium]
DQDFSELPQRHRDHGRPDQQSADRQLKARELLIGLLLLAIVLVDGIVLVQAAPPVGAEKWQVLVGLLAYCQLDLLVLWAVLGTRLTPVRTLILAAGLGLCVVLLWNPAVLQGFRKLGIQTLVFPAHSLVFFAMLSFARLGRLVLIDQTADIPRAGFQLSIGRLLVWTAVVAVPLGQLREMLVWPDAAQALRDAWLPLAQLSATMAVLSLATAWAAMADRRPIVRYLPLLGAIVVTTLVEAAWVVVPDRGRLWGWIPGGITALQTAYLLGPLWVFRICGYRITRCGPGSQN